VTDALPAGPEPENGPLEDCLLLHLLDHRGHQVRFEADQWTTEFGIFRAFAATDLGQVKNALRGLEMNRAIYRQSLRNLEMAHCIYQRVQYVIGYSEPKLVYSLTPGGHRRALELRRRREGLPPSEDGGFLGLPTGAHEADLPPGAARPAGLGE
jgi:hypothetical protein